jgi:pSer/pThr/pTyr-binding forkhead associated (FHA) protein
LQLVGGFPSLTQHVVQLFSNRPVLAVGSVRPDVFDRGGYHSMLKVGLKVVGGTHGGKVISLTKQRFLIGRGEDCQLRPASDQISRNHCAFSVDDYTVRLRDLGSTNGTHVNGSRINGEVILKDGDRVRIGALEFDLQIAHQQMQNDQTTEPDASKLVLPSEVAFDTGEILASDTVYDMPTTPAEIQTDISPVAGDSTVIVPNQQPQPTPQSQVEQYPPTNQPVQPVAPDGQPYPVQPPVPAQPLPGAITPYPPAAYPYQQQPGAMYPQQPFPQQPFPQQPYAYPGYMPMPGQPAPYPPQPGIAPPGTDPAATYASAAPEIPVKLPSPESTGAAPQAAESQQPGQGETSSVQEVNPSTSAADIIKNMRNRRPGT